ncbi:MAG TPA: methylated-DNA--[protein]-cysteine S-methyltransferase [Burkholderiaceae bacterium]|jgi:methylated-DNA-[protein]-cysteine S-methyltransferase|nr:methylated-DNA--[protein]-cysteine S-methyltransferase [Burkholderiaceae bacterium]
MTYYMEYDSPLGTLLLAATERGLCGTYFEEDRCFKGTKGWQADADHPMLQQARRELGEYFKGERAVFNVPLDLQGTEFQRMVWRELLRIPFGRTVSYAEQAKRIGNPQALRAVGTANGHNPVSIIVPCHRVIGSSGALTGYGGGLERKRALLELEGIKLP